MRNSKENKVLIVLFLVAIAGGIETVIIYLLYSIQNNAIMGIGFFSAGIIFLLIMMIAGFRETLEVFSRR